jgi:DNA-binding response OmpR family regulator
MAEILIVDDEAGIRAVLSGILSSAGYRVESAASAEEALLYLEQNSYDLMIVDLQMTGMDGISLIQNVRARPLDLGIMVLTGFATVDTAVAALREDVDDYLIKPATPNAIRTAVRRALARRRERRDQTALLARIVSDAQSLLGQASPAGATPPPPPTAVEIGPLCLDEATHLATWHGQTLDVTPTGFKLLAYLARHAGQVMSPQALVKAAQGYDCSPREARELIKPHLYALRAALESDPAHPHYLLNVRGVGYTLRLG